MEASQDLESHLQSPFCHVRRHSHKVWGLKTWALWGPIFFLLQRLTGKQAEMTTQLQTQTLGQSSMPTIGEVLQGEVLPGEVLRGEV